ncbi:MAG: hypothetical protein IPJ66_13495 [Bacteroidetes bacterium]|nr:hypothetical protein [Bacteroidota bacterium]
MLQHTVLQWIYKCCDGTVTTTFSCTKRSSQDNSRLWRLRDIPIHGYRLCSPLQVVDAGQTRDFLSGSGISISVRIPEVPQV